MNKLIIIAVIAFLGAAYAGSAEDAHAEILKLSSEIDADGHYSYDFDTSNGIHGDESGVGGHHASGSNSWHSPEGEHFETSYVADENGYQPKGAHLPTPPPIPYQIQEALEYIRAHPSNDQGNYHH